MRKDSVLPAQLISRRGLLIGSSLMTTAYIGGLEAAWAGSTGCPADLAAVKADLAPALASTTVWDGPTTGPKAAKDKFVVFVSQSQQSAGALGVSAGAAEAAKALGWKYQIIDGQGTESGNSAALQQGMALKPDGIIVGALTAVEFETLLKQATAQGIKLVAWHASGIPGKIPEVPGIIWNISTDPYTIAKTAGEYVVLHSKGTAQVVIFNDPQYPIVRTKVRGESNAVLACSTAKILAKETCPFTELSTRMPTLMQALLQRFGDHGIGYMMAHNDLYFDFAVPVLRSAGLPPSGPPFLVSAGDGSESAYERIRSGQYQVATVPEPLNLHGWQCMDELNRAMADAPASGYITKVHLVTTDNINEDGGKDNRYDPPNGYRDQYKRIWGIVS
jgi:ribose transport system substrate-binding protein